MARRWIDTHFDAMLSLCGFLAIGFAPILIVLAVFQVMRRAAGFSLLRPAREILFTVLRREDKYKAKSFIDSSVIAPAIRSGRGPTRDCMSSA